MEAYESEEVMARKKQSNQATLELDPIPEGKMRSESSVTKGIIIDIPPTAQLLLDAKGDYIYKCPHCGNWATDEDCDAIGAEDNCLFCNQCNQEFDIG